MHFEVESTVIVMLNLYPKLSVVIPVRDRADTLVHTLKTVTTQDYDNLEIIISDNASQDNTREVVTNIDDKRIKYANTGKRIGMSENWEHGLSLVTGDYVMFLGDDDGLLPHACRDVAALIVKTGTKAVIWRKPDYTWPCVKWLPNALQIQVNFGLVEMRGDIILKLVAAGRSGYGRLPVIYSGFVSTGTITQIKKESGRFFQSVTPDIYSGIVLAYKLDSYLYSMRPFSINGGSRHSNGLNQLDPESVLSQKFFTETNLDIDNNFPLIRGSVSSCVAEAFCQAKKRMLVGTINLNKKRYYRLVYHELKLAHSTLRIDGFKKLLDLDLPKSLRNEIRNQLAHETKTTRDKEFDSDGHKNYVTSLNDGFLQINCDNFNVKNSFDACQLVGSLLGEYKVPSQITKASYPAYVFLAISRKLDPLFKKYMLPF